MADNSKKRPAMTIEAPPRLSLIEMMDRYMRLTPDLLIAEARRLEARDHVRADPEVQVFLGVLTGRIAALEDRLADIRRVTLN